jgi:hypothetical protein
MFDGKNILALLRNETISNNLANISNLNEFFGPIVYNEWMKYIIKNTAAAFSRLFKLLISLIISTSTTFCHNLKGFNKATVFFMVKGQTNNT